MDPEQNRDDAAGALLPVRAMSSGQVIKALGTDGRPDLRTWWVGGATGLASGAGVVAMQWGTATPWPLIALQGLFFLALGGASSGFFAHVLQSRAGRRIDLNRSGDVIWGKSTRGRPFQFDLQKAEAKTHLFPERRWPTDESQEPHAHFVSIGVVLHLSQGDEEIRIGSPAPTPTRNMGRRLPPGTQMPDLVVELNELKVMAKSCGVHLPLAPST
jgi:hypothetical protein